MRILMFGRTGQVATEMLRLAGPDLEINALGRADVNLEYPETCAAAVRASRAEAVINAAGYTAVDHAEHEEALATVINGDAPGAIARAAAERGIPFLHLSTDYVFDGKKEGAWTEEDCPAPLNAYGRSKLAGERAVAAADGPHAILRTSWLHASHGGNFVREMLNVGASAGASGRPLRIVADQCGGPTSARDVAVALMAVSRALVEGRGSFGIFHFSGAPAVTWCEFAREIFARTRWIRTPEIVPISSLDWRSPAVRPANSVLDCTRIQRAYGITQPDWRVSLEPILDEIKDPGVWFAKV